MASSSFDKEIILSIIQNLISSIHKIYEWNESIHSADDYLTSPEGQKTLAATSMLIDAIGEGVGKIDKQQKVNF